MYTDEWISIVESTPRHTIRGRSILILNVGQNAVIYQGRIKIAPGGQFLVRGSDTVDVEIHPSFEFIPNATPPSVDRGTVAPGNRVEIHRLVQLTV